jgi:hypothetical protein
MRVKKLTLATAAALSLGVGAVQADTVTSQIFPGLNQLSDNSAESLIKGTGNTGGTILEEGDRLRGIFDINTTEQLGGGGNGTLGLTSGNNQLAGIFDITLVTKIEIPPALPGLDPTFQFIFAPTALVTSGFGTDFGAPDGTAVIFFENATSPGTYSRLDETPVAPTCTTTGAGGDCEALITTGSSVYWYAGFTADPTDGDFWVANATTDDVSEIGDLDPGLIGGTYNLGIHRLAGGTGIALGIVSCAIPGSTVNFCGSGSLLGIEGANTPYDSFDNVDFVINNQVIPEPGSLALLGLGLGLGALGLRRRPRS